MNFLIEIIHREHFLIESGAHNRDSIIIVLNGKFQCEAQGKPFTAGPGDICTFQAGQLFTRRVLETIRCVYIQFEPFPVKLSTGILETTDPIRTENTVNHLVQAVQKEDRELAEHLIWDILLMRRQERSATIPPTLSACLSYLNEHCAEKISLEKLSAQFSISKQGLIRQFRQGTGKTPIDYLTNLRITKAKHLLRDTALPVSEIADACGFENVYYFSNSFKRQAGISPSGYRKMLDL